MPVSGFSSRVRVDGKFFRVGDEKFHVKGITYGPFEPNGLEECLPEPDRAQQDLQLIRELGCNVVRIYHVPPRWFLDAAAEAGLRLFVDIPLQKLQCFLDPSTPRVDPLRTVREAARACKDHPGMFAISVVNEVPADVARWAGIKAVSDRIDELIAEVKSVDPDQICTFCNFPPTEYLCPREVDFVSFNVYLHHRAPFENYMARLQMQAEGRPLVLSEFGMDSIREGEVAKCELLGWQIEAAFNEGLAGTVVFSFTDDWYTGGRQVEDWGLGLTTVTRKPKDSFAVVQQSYRTAPYFPLPSVPMVSVVVACYNGAKTLRACLQSLSRLNYPDYEVILIDDGSTDATPQIASQFESVRYIPQRNHGLSVARNSGIAAARGEVVAFMDADCRADEDWLYFLVQDLMRGGLAGVGGPNLLPPEDSPVAGAVMVSPGGPAHVMLTDRLAEHIPGCNMAFYKWALEEIGCFDPVFRRAGDDVDICWRLQQRGHRIGFSPSAFVWHYRRSTMAAYLRQQEGYGHAESLLERRHPEYFNSLGGSLWRGRIYAAAKTGLLPRGSVIYHGIFGTGLFQTLYAGQPAVSLMLCTSLEYHVLVTLPLLVLSVPFNFLWPVPLTTFLISITVCGVAALQADLPRTRRRFWSRPLVALLFFLQPIVRGWARYKGRLAWHPTPPAARERPKAPLPPPHQHDNHRLRYRCENPEGRIRFLNNVLTLLDEEGWTNKPDTGWDDCDVEIYGNRWSRLQLTTASERGPDGSQTVHCRLHSAWSLAAVTLFWGTLAGELLLIGMLAPRMAWAWMVLLSIPMLGWYLEQENRHLAQLITRLLDAAAKTAGLKQMTKVEAQGPRSP